MTLIRVPNHTQKGRCYNQAAYKGRYVGMVTLWKPMHIWLLVHSGQTSTLPYMVTRVPVNTTTCGCN